MKIKHQELVIPPNNPFENCKLKREPYANVLTDIVTGFADGFVLAINNEWGTGKTTFVKMWKQQLEDQQFKTVYFNAWENDFDNNPLVAIMSEMGNLTNDDNDVLFKSVVQKGAKLIKNIAPALIKALASKYIDYNVLVDTIENTAKATTEVFEEEIKEYTSKKKSIVEFRKELEKFVRKINDSKPLVFIIDELDRCRPNYSVEVLEQVKHLFSVPGIVFVLSIDKKHLGSAIKGFYGSESIESDEYLRRFIDLEYSIPEPSTSLFIDYLYKYYQLQDFFLSKERKLTGIHNYEDTDLLRTANLLFTKSNTTLRQQERIFAHTRLVLSSLKDRDFSFSNLLFILVYLKLMNNEIYKKIERNEYSLQQLSDTFYDILYFNKIPPFGLNFLYLESLLLWFYNNDRDEKLKINLYTQDDKNNYISDLKSNFETNGSTLGTYFKDLDSSMYCDYNLRYLLNKINLTESVTIA